MAKLAPNNDLVARMDGIAIRLLRELAGDMPGQSVDDVAKICLDDRLSTFAHVTRWVAVRHKIEGLTEEKELDGLKRALKGAPSRRAAERNRIDRTADRILRDGPDLGATHAGETLAALRQRLPILPIGDDDGNIGDSGG